MKYLFLLLCACSHSENDVTEVYNYPPVASIPSSDVCTKPMTPMPIEAKLECILDQNQKLRIFIKQRTGE